MKVGHDLGRFGDIEKAKLAEKGDYTQLVKVLEPITATSNTRESECFVEGCSFTTCLAITLNRT